MDMLLGFKSLQKEPLLEWKSAEQLSRYIMSICCKGQLKTQSKNLPFYIINAYSHFDAAFAQILVKLPKLTKQLMISI